MAEGPLATATRRRQCCGEHCQSLMPILDPTAAEVITCPTRLLVLQPLYAVALGGCCERCGPRPPPRAGGAEACCI